MIPELGASFLIGFFGSLHCLGMCGPLVMAYSLYMQPMGIHSQGVATPFRNWGFSHHLPFHLGRLATYGILGALAAGLLDLLGLNLYQNFRGGIVLVGGGLITLLGLIFLRVIPFPIPLARFSGNAQPLLNRFIPSLFTIHGPWSKVAPGATCGLLPCCLSGSMLIKAAMTGNMVEGFLTMASFGLGTVPALLSVGFSASFLTIRTRLIGERVAALSVMVMGLFLMFKGARFLV
jgi:sulfite exporter TauE/SafE